MTVPCASSTTLLFYYDLVPCASSISRVLLQPCAMILLPLYYIPKSWGSRDEVEDKKSFSPVLVHLIGLLAVLTY